MEEIKISMYVKYAPVKARKSLAFAGENIENTSTASLEWENKMLSKLNVENPPSDGVKILS